MHTRQEREHRLAQALCEENRRGQRHRRENGILPAVARCREQVGRASAAVCCNLAVQSCRLLHLHSVGTPLVPVGVGWPLARCPVDDAAKR
jgi:hypothetical protein